MLQSDQEIPQPEGNESVPAQESSSAGDEFHTASPSVGDMPPDGENAAVEADTQEVVAEERRRRWLLLLLLLLLFLLGCCSLLFLKYLRKPEPLPELLPAAANLNYAPHYLFSIYGMDQPVGVSLSPGNDRIYVSETGGDRLVRIFDRDGDPLGTFAPANTRSGERSPVYLATDNAGRVFVTDRLQHVVFVYDRDGNPLDTIMSPEMSLSQYVAQHIGGLRAGMTFSYNIFQGAVYFQEPGAEPQLLPPPEKYAWAPLGIRIDASGTVFLTDVVEEHNQVRIFSLSNEPGTTLWQEAPPPVSPFGDWGQGSGEFLYPNAAVADSRGRIYVSDGNNGRISVWDGQGNFLFHFGRGSGDGSLNLPRGMVIDSHDRLHVVDAVGQNIKVYDVSGDEPAFLFSFGDLGLDDGQFNYPNDIALDSTGRLYIADRENNRIQVWSY